MGVHRNNPMEDNQAIKQEAMGRKLQILMAERNSLTVDNQVTKLKDNLLHLPLQHNKLGMHNITNKFNKLSFKNFAQFASVDTDRSGSITAQELQKVTFGGFPLGLDIAIKLVKVFDKDRSGNIDFFEYASMHQFITLMQRSFTNADRDRSGTLDYREIHTALQSSGFTIGLAPTQLFFNKVSRGSAHINFPQFLQLGADIALLRSKFEWSDTDKDGVIHINFGQLLEICA